MKLKRKAFHQCVLPVLTYEAETLTLTKMSAMKLERTQNGYKMGINFRDKVRNEEIRKRTRVQDVIECTAKRRWKWAGHIASDDGWIKKNSRMDAKLMKEAEGCTLKSCEQLAARDRNN